MRQSLLSFSLALCIITKPLLAYAITGGEDKNPLADHSVMILNSNGGVCSGVVVAADVVLTAAHCATKADQHRIHFRNGNDEAVLIETEAKAIHPDYRPAAARMRKPSIDLALFKLKEALPTQFTKAVFSTNHPRSGTNIIAGGYGFSKAHDRRSMGIFFGADFNIREPYGAGKFLIWLQGENGAAICSGDSGGPLSIGGVVFAITAWAEVSHNAPCSKNGQGVLLGPQRQWLDQILSRWKRSMTWQD